MDVSATFDGCCRDGRRNRAVPIPRRWDQVLGDELRATVANKPGTPGRPRISRNTIAQGMFGQKIINKINGKSDVCPPLCRDPRQP